MAIQAALNRAILLVVLLLAGTTAASTQKASGPLAAVIDQVTALFPKVEGEVIEAQGQTLTVSLGQRDGVKEGLTLSVFREGRELRHPKTGEVLGKTEQSLGRVVLSQIFEAYSIGGVTQGSGILAGDKVRVSAGKIPLTLLTLSDGVKAPLTEAVANELIEALNQTGRFQVSQGDQVAVFLAQSGVKGSEALDGKGIGAAVERFKIEQLLVAHLSRAQGKPYMELRLFSQSRPEPTLSTALFVPPSVKPPPQGGFSASIGTRDQPRPKEQRSLLARLLGWEKEAGTYSAGEGAIPLREVARFNFPVLAMDVVLSPKDGIPRMAVTNGEKVYQYRIVNQKLELEWSLSVRSLGGVISLQLADLDGDGVFEVVGNRWHPQGGLNSFIITAKEGKPRFLIDNASDLLFAVDLKGEGVKQTLWAQKYDSQKFFTQGQADQMSLKNGKLVVERPARVPAAFRAMGAAFSNITGKDTRALAFVDESNRLQIAVEGEELWRSSTSVGGGYLVVEQVLQIGRDTRSQFYKMEPPPVAVDLDGDGVEEIVIPQNLVQEGLLAVVFRGPTGFRLQSVNSGFEGAITGLGAFRTDENAQPTLVAAVARFKGMLRTAGETQIIMTVPEE